MRHTILRAVVGTAIGMGISMFLGFVKSAVAQKIYPSGGFIPLVPSGLTAAIMIAILLGIFGGFIGLIVGALGLRPFQGAAVGVIVVILRWREVFDRIRSIAAKIQYGQQSGHFNSAWILSEILAVSMVFDFVLVGALVSILLRRVFALSR